MAIMDPTLVIACNYTPMRRALIDLLTDRFPRANVRLVFDAAHVLLAEHMRVDAVFVDAHTRAPRLHALRDALGDTPILVCDTPTHMTEGAARPSGAPLHSALPTLCGMFPLSAPCHVLELERALLGRVPHSRRAQIVSIPHPMRRGVLG